MSTLLEQASLIMIPSGYKEDVVYSVIPENGNGDLSFTRASNGTRVNSAGLVEVVAWNLQTYSEDFTNGTYTVNQASITSNATTAPNGTLTADKLVENTANDQHFLYFTSQQIAYNETRISVYAKAGGRTNLLMWESAITNAQCLFNLSTGVVSSSSSGNAANLSTTVGQIEDAGNGWYRCSFNYSTSSGGGTIRLQLYTTTTSYTGDGTSGIFIWGLQENIGSTAKPYFPTTDRLNVPRLTYQNGGGGCPSLLLEKQSTNLVSYSQDFTNVYWNKTNLGIGDVAVVTANYAISPDGTQNATRFVCNLNGGTTASTRSWMLANFTPQATVTMSIWIKLNSAGTKTIVFSDSGGETKTISGTDWQRIDATFVSAGGEFRIGLVGGISSDTLDCCIWGAQAESGSYPTSYIPTTSSSATRVADACSKTGISSLIGQTEGVLFVEVKNFVRSASSLRLIAVSDGGFNNRIVILTGSFTNLINVIIVTAASTQADYTANIGTNVKIALAYSSAGSVLYVNGAQVGSSSSMSVPATSQLFIGTREDGTTGFAPNGTVAQSILFPTRLTNAECISLTT